MMISGKMQEFYPKMSLWIAENIPKAKYKPKVYSAFLKRSELSKESGSKALTLGSYPIIDYMYMGENEDNGRFFPIFSEKVFIADAICDKFEFSEADANNEKMHLLVESTILHEIVHWGDYGTDNKAQRLEAGNRFERRAYGKLVHRYW